MFGRKPESKNLKREALGLREIVDSPELASFLTEIIEQDKFELRDTELADYVWRRAPELSDRNNLGTVLNVCEKIHKGIWEKKWVLEILEEIILGTTGQEKQIH